MIICLVKFVILQDHSLLRFAMFVHSMSISDSIEKVLGPRRVDVLGYIFHISIFKTVIASRRWFSKNHFKN